MRIYSQADEEKVRAQAAVREWQRSGFLDTSQAAQISNELRVDFRRTNFFLRAVLFLFTSIVVAAAVSLVITVLDLNQNISNATLCVIAAIACFGAVEFFIRNFRLYRFGVEEALAVAAAVLLSIATALLTPRFKALDLVVPLAIGAVGALSIYLRYGYLYAAIASLLCAAAVPFPIHLPGEARRLLAALVCAFSFSVVRKLRLRHGDDFPGDDYGLIQAAAWAGLYLATNLRVGFDRYEYYPYEQGFFYWVTYAMTWILPIVGFWLSLRSKDRPLMNVSLLTALITLSTNKPYLHLMQQPWDPILFGLFLIASAVFLKRWLGRGTNGQRRGFTAARLLARDRQALSLVSTASAALQPAMPPSPTPAAKPNFDGGRSGGAGASGSF
jgi:hypothetical protein